MGRFIGIDIGTSGAKAVAIDENGTVTASASVGYEPDCPQPQWSEQHPDVWVDACSAVLTEVQGAAADSIGITGQMHGAVVLDQESESIRPSILWNDQRTEPDVVELEESFGGLIRATTLNPPMTGFQVSKLLWLRRNEPDTFRQIHAVLLPKDYVRFKLTGNMNSDPSDASGTGVFDVGAREWAEKLMDSFDIPRRWFPSLAESAEVVGRWKGIPVVCGAGDQAAAAIGVGGIDSSVASICLGTSGVVFRALEKRPAQGEDSVHLFCDATGGWHAMGVMLSCAGAVRWFRDTFCERLTFDQLTAVAETAPKGCDGLSFLPYLNGERCPYIEPSARAAFMGATSSHGLGHFTRAVFEGATFGIWGASKAVGIPSTSRIRVTGGGAKSGFWMQMLADGLQRECAVVETDEGPALGAALLGAVGVGAFGTIVEAVRACVRERDVYLPRASGYEEIFERIASLHDHSARRQLAVQ